MVLAVLSGFGREVTDDGRALIEPLRTRFEMIDGVAVTGTVTTWSPNWIDGSFGRRQWTEIDARDVWRLYRRLMDLEDAGQWAELGRVLLLCALEQDEVAERARRNAERAFARAMDLDPDAADAIDAAQAEVRRIKADREALARAIEEERLSTANPEAGEWRAQPWPDLTPAEQRTAVLTMRNEAKKIVESVGLSIEPVETEYFLFYSDMPRRETARWARELDHMYARLAEIFDLDDGRNIFWGKAVVLVFNDQDRFRLVEAQAFNHLAGQWEAGLCHQRGPMVFVNFFRQPDDYTFAAILVHETVHGFMHRFLTPMRLPVWANEGFAEYVSAVSFDNSPVDRGRRQQGLDFIRSGGDVSAILEMKYTDGSWPGPDSIGYPVSYLLVSLMIEDRPRAFGRWVEAVKGGKDWRVALVDDFGVDVDTLVDRFVRYYRVND